MSWCVNWEAVSAVGGWVSAVATIGALFFAGKALNTWREQEKTKAKMDFKKSLLGIRNALVFMPNLWNKQQLAVSSAAIGNPELMRQMSYGLVMLATSYKDLLDAYNKANDCWVMCEHLFESSPIEVKWNNIIQAFGSYLEGGKENSDLFDPINELYNEPFVFNRK